MNARMKFFAVEVILKQRIKIFTLRIIFSYVLIFAHDHNHHDHDHDCEQQAGTAKTKILENAYLHMLKNQIY